MRYVKARCEEQSRDLAYRAYVTDCLRGIVGANGRWLDSIHPQPQPKEDNRPCEEIVDDIWARGFGKKA